MSDTKYDFLKAKMTQAHWRRLQSLNNPTLTQFISSYTRLACPDTIFIANDSEEDIRFIKNQAIQNGEEIQLATPGHTMHYDGYHDQGQDKSNLRYVLSKKELARHRHLQGFDEASFSGKKNSLIRDSMRGKQAIVKFYALAPIQSDFEKLCVQFTDSFYLCHIQNILYREGFQRFAVLKEKDKFYKFFHSAGLLNNNGVSKRQKKRRIIIQPDKSEVIALNTQYAGNTGIKNNAMRLLILDGIENNWLCEHMCLFGVPEKDSETYTYFAGAFPSACGRRTTFSTPGYHILGDDVTFIKNIDGTLQAVNPERGMYGILQDIPINNESRLSQIFKSGKPVIFNNVLLGADNQPYWQGMNTPTPKEGTNHWGPWRLGQRDKKGNPVPIGHPNGRFATPLSSLNDIDIPPTRSSVPLHGLIIGGRDTDTSVPIEQAPDWRQGILLKGCTLETESTSATLNRECLWFPNLMANSDYISSSLSAYTRNLLHVGASTPNPPYIFCVNYFLKDFTGDYHNSVNAKRVWIKWACLRIHGKVKARSTPMGFIPLFEDLSDLFKELTGESYFEDEYIQQFSFRCINWIKKIERIKAHYQSNAPDLSEIADPSWDAAIKSLNDIKEKYGPIIPPGTFEEPPLSI